MNVPVPLPDVASAKLPAVYESAKQALAECERVDECKTWADKMAALASYARQAEDETLLKHAMRIQGRAVRRAGELLKEFDARQGQNLPEPKKEGDRLFSQHPPISRHDAGAKAQMSPHQVKQAVRVSNIPPDEFEAAIESPKPPTVTALAEMGKKPRPTKVIDHLDGRDPKDFALATEVLSALRRHAESVIGVDHAAVVRGSAPDEHREALSHIATLSAWLETLKLELESVDGVQRHRPDYRDQEAYR